MKKIDLGNEPNDGTGDSFTDAFVKINENFKEAFEFIDARQPYRIIVWEKWEDTMQAMKDINHNFKKLEKNIK